MRKLLIFSAAFAAAALYMCYSGSAAVWIALVCALACAAVFSLGKKAGKPYAVALLGLSIGLLWSLGYQAVFYEPLEQLPEGKVKIEAELLRTPEPTQYGWGAEIRMKLGTRSFDGILYASEKFPAEPGDVLTCMATLRKASAEELYRRSEGILLIASSKTTPRVVKKGSFSQFPAKISGRLQTLCRHIFPKNVSGLMQALLTGNRSGLSDGQKKDLRRAGIYHIAAISGMHVSVLIGAICIFLRRRPRLRLLFGLPIIVFFVLMTGASASAMRAGFMQAFLLLSSAVDRDYDPPTSIAAALLLILLQNPWAIAGVGLQLSFCAVIGIALFAKKLCNALLHLKTVEFVGSRFVLLRRLFQSVSVVLATSLSVSAVSLPLLILYFGEYSLIGIVSNVLLLWLIPVLLIGGILSCIAGAVYLPAAIACGTALSYPAQFVLDAAKLLGNVPFGVLSAENGYHVIFLFMFYAALLAMLILPIQNKRLCVFLLAGAFAVCMGLSVLEISRSDFSFSMLDVGQGQCLILQSGGKFAMIDCGAGYAPDAAEKAEQYLRRQGCRSLDCVIVTHFDFDHVSGLLYLFEEFPVKNLIVPNTGYDKPLRRSVLHAAEEAGVSVCCLQKDDFLLLGEAVLQLMLPCAEQREDNCGICVLASCREYDILITGDLPKEEEPKLTLPADGVELLVAGHHGSNSSTGQPLLEKARPQAVLISVGEENAYGHPNEETLQRIARSGAVIVRTDQNGTIVFRR